MKCQICGNECAGGVWANIPLGDEIIDIMCDNCFNNCMGSYLEEHSPEFDRFSCSHIKQYNKALELFKKIKSE